MRVEVLNRLNEVVKEFPDVMAAVEFAHPLSFIPGERIALVIYADTPEGERLVDIQCWGI